MNKRINKIMVLSGKRGGFGAMKSLLRKINTSKKFKLILVLTDQHLDKKFGNTYKEVQKEFLVNNKFKLNQKDDTPLERSKALSKCLYDFSIILNKLKPDLLVLYGDRGEVLSAAFASNNIGIPVAHIQGGDISGSIDEHFRHSITKLSHIHFPSNVQSAKRIEKMGENKKHIHVVGDNHLDQIYDKEFLKKKEILKLLKINLSEKIIVVLQHSEATEPEKSFFQMNQTLLPLVKKNYQIIIIYPCSDPGYEGIIRSIKNFKSKYKNIKIFKNLDAPVFLGLLNVSSLLVGNSSSGIIESTLFKLPVINIGKRQNGRLCSSNVIHTSHSKIKIENAINKAFNDKKYISNLKNIKNYYGNGNAGNKIVKILENYENFRNLFVKNFINDKK